MTFDPESLYAVSTMLPKAIVDVSLWVSLVVVSALGLFTSTLGNVSTAGAAAGGAVSGGLGSGQRFSSSN